MELEDRLHIVITQFFGNEKNYKIQPFGSGHINRTFFLQHPEGAFILQKINTSIFKNPKILCQNFWNISQHLTEKNYPRAIQQLRRTKSGGLFFQNKNGECWRVFNYIKNTHSYNNAISEQQVLEAAKGFGEFIFYLKDMPTEKIHPTIPDFHNTKLRIHFFEKAIQQDISKRVKNVKNLLPDFQKYYFLAEKMANLTIPLRMVHYDTKINNLLFDERERVSAVVDWDTVMPGNVLFDFGDMVRTMACTHDESSEDFEKIKIHLPYFEAIVKGFAEATFSFLTLEEKRNLLLGAQAIIFEQAIRFLTDYLNGDIYYNINFPNQNLHRAKNQLALLEDIFSKEKELQFFFAK